MRQSFLPHLIEGTPRLCERKTRTSEQMILRHYRRWIPGLQVGTGRRTNRLFDKTLEVADLRKVSLKLSLSSRRKAKAQDFLDFQWSRRGIEPPTGFGLLYGKSA